MAHSGPLPKENRVNRNPQAEWTNVDNVPFVAGQEHELPKGRDWNPSTQRWWSAVRVMPHARLWRETDWLFAEDTAYLKDDFYNGEAAGNATQEMRRREDLMGTTIEARRKLRIRYVEPRLTPSGDTSAPGTVTSISDRRKRLREE